MEQLIPALMDDLGRECLVRIPYEAFPSAISVCKSWAAEIQLPEFWKRRRSSGVTRPVVVLVQAQSEIDPNQKRRQSGGSKKCPVAAMPRYRLLLCEPEAGVWRQLPSVPGLAYGLPMFCGVVGVGQEVVILGGWDPETWQVTNAVYVFSFLTATWRRVADMPGGRRSFFGCAADEEGRRILVAGGHDGEKNALRSAVLYDLESDEWTSLPDMAKERDECKAVFQGGKFHVISGYSTDSQGQFDRSVEKLNFVNFTTWQWDPMEQHFLEEGTTMRACMVGQGGKIFSCRAGDVAVYVDDKWSTVAELPAEVSSSPYVSMWRDRIMVIGSSKYGEPQKCCILDLDGRKWAKLDVPESYCGKVRSGGCFLEL